METTTFFPGAPRLVMLGSPTLQASTRRICIPIAMPLDADSFKGMPDWVSEAYDAVAKRFERVDPGVEQIVDIALHFSNDKPKEAALFTQPRAKVPSAELRKFEVLRVGEGDNPDIELHFKAYTPYSREFWSWIGEMAGQEVYMAFPKIGDKPAPGPVQGKLLDGGKAMEGALDADSKAILDGDKSKSPAAAPAKKTAAKKAAKSGTNELKEFHSRIAAAAKGKKK